ncbi:DNA-binding transcriptional LysR family regulator [Trichococcus patagoniensis]|uniref:DNA-binding transcriptional LysR family regulator n=1 Tax=Trichococcus patagoniensis TaxID=382641 RepID=A0A2T5IJ08_9LACT|nr:LysR family transcriptional regulator [Trichococcus patagoniensis]PTQ83798.1 DNA-binding transcriptional LysR family regulator [Trichococcus patagoniensis]
MYNHQLNTFIMVADSGSFNKASEELYVSPNAVMKQINLLESSLGFELFVRTHRGVRLTPAGESFYRDAKYLIQYAKDSIVRAEKMVAEPKHVLRIGTSLTTPVQFLVSLWPQIRQHNPDLKFELVSFENTPENAREIMNHFGRNIDLVAGIYSENMLSERHCAALKLYDTPLCAAVSLQHRLAANDEITLADLFDEKVMLIQRGYMRAFDEVRNDLAENYPRIQIEDFSFFDVNVFNKCENDNAVLIAVDEWKNVHPLLKIIPISWGHTIPMGILHSDKPSADVEEFLEIIGNIYAMQS